MRTLLTALASVLLLLAGSCTSPLASLKVGSTALPPVGPGETQLVFHLNSSAKAVDYTKYSLGVIQYLVVQLHSKNGQGSKFASATVTGTTVPVNIRGLVAGPWELLVSAYDWDGITGTTSPWVDSPDDTQPTLLYTAMDQLSILPGTSNSVSLLLYKPGDLGDVGLTEAVMVNDVTLSPVAPLAAIPTTIIAGSAAFQVSASAWNNLALSTSASDQTFSWYSDNPDVVTVSSSGGPLANVFPKSPGTAKITVTSRESEKYGTNKYAQFTLTVQPAIVGYWKYHDSMSAPPSDRIIKVFQGSSGLEMRYITGLGGPSMQSNYRGAFTATGPSSFTFKKEKTFDFSTDMEMTGDNYLLSINQSGPDSLSVSSTSPVNETVTYHRIVGAKPVTGLNLPAGSLKTGQTLYGRDSVVPADASVAQLAFREVSATAATNVFADRNSIMMNNTPMGNVVIQVRSMEDPSIFVQHTYTIDRSANVPTNLNVPIAVVTGTSITLNWTNSSNDGLQLFDVYRATGAGTFSLVSGTGVTVANMLASDWTDSGLSAGTEYRYYVVARGGTGTSNNVYVDSVPTPVISTYTLTAANLPVVVTGPVFNPGSNISDRGDGTMVPSWMVSVNIYGAQFYTSNSGPFTGTGSWFRAGETIWMLYSLPLGVTPAGTLIVKWNQQGAMLGTLVVPGVTKLWQVAPSGGNQFTLSGVGTSTGTITWNPPTMDFVTP